jgi:uroporphyrinogen-III synthase
VTLADRTILVTRPQEQSGAMVRSIVEAGGRCVVVPMIRIAPPESWAECDGIIAELQEFHGAAFASVNAVEAFCGRVRLSGRTLDGLFPDGVIAVGEATAGAARGFGLAVRDVHAVRTGRAAGQAAGRDFAGRRVLVPRGDLGREDLPEALAASGASVTTAVVYRTIPPVPEVLMDVAARVKRKEFDAVSFASPSAVRNFMSAFGHGEIGTMSSWCALAVIGPTTASALREFGLEPDVVAPTASGRALVDSLIAHYAKK